jgi:putative membrane protein
MLCRFEIKKAWQTLPWRFMLALVAGIGIAILAFSGIIIWLLENRFSGTMAFFFGLILASIFTVWNRVHKWSISRYAAAVAGAAGAWMLVGLPMASDPPDSLLYIVFCGAIAICAMILPGISGSFILLLLGRYDYIFSAINNCKSALLIQDWQVLYQNILILVCFFIGIVLGISSFVRLLSWLFRKYNDLTVAILIGFMAGALRKVWPWQMDGGNFMPERFDHSVLTAIALTAAGFTIVFLLERIAAKAEQKG